MADSVRKPKEGDLILRRVHFDREGLGKWKARVDSFDPWKRISKNDRGAYTFKAGGGGDTTTEFVAIPNMKVAGIVCFCNVEIPEDFSHFIIRKTLKDGACLIVEPVRDSFDNLKSLYQAPDQLKVAMNDALELKIAADPKWVLDHMSAHILAQLDRQRFMELLEKRFEKNRDMSIGKKPKDFSEIKDLQEGCDEIVEIIDRAMSLLQSLHVTTQDEQAKERLYKSLQKMKGMRGETIDIIRKMIEKEA